MHGGGLPKRRSIRLHEFCAGQWRLPHSGGTITKRSFRKQEPALHPKLEAGTCEAGPEWLEDLETLPTSDMCQGEAERASRPVRWTIILR